MDIKNKLTELSYEELVQLAQEKQITMIEFVEANTDLYPDWEEWLEDNNLEKTNGAANVYLEYKDKEAEQSPYDGSGYSSL